MDLPELSDEQWEFLAVLEAFENPVSIDLAGHLAPLLPGPLFDLLDKAQSLGWIDKLENNRLALGLNLPPQALTRLRAINHPEHLESLVGRIYQENLIEKLDLSDRLVLLDKAGRVKQAAECEVDLARLALSENRFEDGRRYLDQAINRIWPESDGSGFRELFLSAVLEFSNLCFSLGGGLTGLEECLLKALEVAGRIGDQRDQALLNLHLGRLYYFSDRRDDALVALSVGFEEIEELGDEDIREQSAEFLGMFYFIKGLFRESLQYLEKAEETLHAGKGRAVINPMAPIFLGYCAAYLGQFHRSIGSLDFNWRLAREQTDPSFSCSLRAVLGTVLALMKKEREAENHLQQARAEALQHHNALGLYLAGGGMALRYFLQGRMEKAYELLTETIREGRPAGLVRQFASPWILEILYEFHRLGFKPIPDFEFSQVLERLLSGVNVHLRGVALRLRARETMSRGGERSAIAGDLAESAECLQESGDPVQLSKTVLEIARMELNSGNRPQARKLIHRARKLLGGYGEEFFPDDLRHLLEEKEVDPGRQEGGEEFLKRYLDMIESLYPSENPNEILGKVLTATSRLFGAERSGLFWFSSGRSDSQPDLRAACNLTRNDVTGESFKAALKLINQTRRTNAPQVGRTIDRGAAGDFHPVRSMLCVPVDINGRAHGVLYYDNSYLDDAFDFFDPVLMKDLVRHTNLVIERRLHFLKVREERNLLASEKSLYQERSQEEIIARSQTMEALLGQVDQVAPTESTVLILGETGSGKELVAKRIHARSLRAESPFMVVDAATIPENLLESELFGHERGAFTGADRQRIGRIELAHQGTLFLDEVGELPWSAQVKLLRALQEKTFSRLGGSRTIHSDFRLIAATNRDLGAEVAAGRFRQDLYYRLNVIPISLPPLRDRPEDISLLAGHFLDRYAVKYKRSGLRLSPDQERMLGRYPWPGNIRELKNIMERAVLLSVADQLDLTLPADITAGGENPFADGPSLDEIQRRYIGHILQKTGGRIAGPGGAAEILGMKRTSLYSRMRMLGMSEKKSSAKRQKIHR